MLIYFEKRFDPIDKIRWKKAEKKGENGKNGKNRKNEEMDFFFSLPRAARKFNPKRPEVKSGSADSLSKIAASTLRTLLPT